MESPIKYEKNGMAYEDILQPYSEEQQQEAEINRENASKVFSPKFIPYYPHLSKKGLTDKEIIIFGFIDFFTSYSSGRFYFTNEQISEIANCSIDTASKSIKKLESLGLITTKRKMRDGGGQIRFVERVPEFPKFDYGNSLVATKEKPGTNKNKIKENKIKEKNIYTPPHSSSQKGSDGQTDTQELKTSSIDILKDRQVLFAIAKTHHVLEDDVRDLALELRLYCQSKGRKYKNYVAALRSWVIKEKKAGKLEEVTIL